MVLFCYNCLKTQIVNFKSEMDQTYISPIMAPCCSMLVYWYDKGVIYMSLYHTILSWLMKFVWTENTSCGNFVEYKHLKVINEHKKEKIGNKGLISWNFHHPHMLRVHLKKKMLELKCDWWGWYKSAKYSLVSEDHLIPLKYLW